MLALYEFILV